MMVSGKKAKGVKKNATKNTLRVWQDDPISKLPPILRPIPDLANGPLKFKFKGRAVKPGLYEPGTAEFRYWTAAEALRRGGDFWAPLLGVKQWQPGAILPVSLNKGVDLNAYYDRNELAFFHQTVGGQTIYSGESPDVVCHEMGHACLDAHRPELFDAPFVETGAFHESFGDMSAILSALQLPSVRAAVLASVKGHKNSALSRCAEQLGWALRQVAPTLVDADCLRNAYNRFKYVDPQTLPDEAPATALCAEAHSFSRVFTGAFYEILSGMLKIRSSDPTQADLAAVATAVGQLLVDATAAAPVRPDYFAQVAAHMIDADTIRYAGKYRSALVDTFVKRLILPRSAVAPLKGHKGKLSGQAAFGMMAAAAAPAKATAQKVLLRGKDFGLSDKPLTISAPSEHRPFLMVAAALAHSHSGADAVHQATHRFVKALFAHDRVDTESSTKKLGVTDGTPRDQLRKTHVLFHDKDGYRLTRRLFHCGCEVQRA